MHVIFSRIAQKLHKRPLTNSIHGQVVGATNRIKLLDEALLRPGRFDRTIYMGRPSTNNRFKILQARAPPSGQGEVLLHCMQVEINAHWIKPRF